MQGLRWLGLGCKVMMRTVVATLLFAATAGVIAGTIDCGSRPIRLAFYDYGFLYFDNEQHQAQGIDKDIIDELAKRSGCKFESQVMVRARIWADLASGEVDMSVSGIQNAERERFAWFAPYLLMKNYAIVQKNIAGQVKSASDFIAQANLSFGVVRAFKHGEEQDRWLTQLRAANRVQESPDVESIFKKLKESRVDAMFSQPAVYRKKIRDLKLDNSVVVQDWTPREKGVPLGLILAKSRFTEKDAEQWRKLIEAMRRDGSLKKIFERYLPPLEAAKLLEY